MGFNKFVPTSKVILNIRPLRPPSKVLVICRRLPATVDVSTRDDVAAELLVVVITDKFHATPAFIYIPHPHGRPIRARRQTRVDHFLIAIGYQSHQVDT